jgi:undecaprenyl-diphosphatase
MGINSFDYYVSASLNHYCGKHELFDRSVVFISDNHFIKGGILAIVIWYAWFAAWENKNLRRQRIISALTGSMISIVIGRLLPHILAYRARPILDPRNNFVSALGFNKNAFDNLSSFPSDHSILFFSIATGFFFISKRLGIAAFLYVLLFIALPRLYLGLHYFTDILFGAVIGIVIVSVANLNFFRTTVSARILSYEAAYPAVFYAMFFFLTFEIAEMFISIRNILSFTLHPHTYVF